VICLVRLRIPCIDGHRRQASSVLRYLALLTLFSILTLDGGVSAQATQPEQRSSLTEALVSDPSSLKLPLGLAPQRFQIPADNPLSEAKIELGQLLFFDSRLSADNSVACATCHSPEIAFSDNVRLSAGINARLGTRNAPALINRIGGSEQFRDGRAMTLEDQAKDPLVNPRELGMSNYAAVVSKLQSISEYRAMFEKAFEREVNIEDLARAIASFERTIVSWNSRWDQFIAGDISVLTKSEMRGLILFQGKGRCTQCHSGWNLTDEKYHNIGIGWDLPEPDVGRFAVTKNENSRGAFRTPTLRDVALTGPYMHDGRFETLEEVVEYYSSGVIANPYLDVEMQRSNLSLEETLELYSQENQAKRRIDFPVQNLELTDQETADLVAFMEALAGEGWQEISAPDDFPK